MCRPYGPFMRRCLVLQHALRTPSKQWRFGRVVSTLLRDRAIYSCNEAHQCHRASSNERKVFTQVIPATDCHGKDEKVLFTQCIFRLLNSIDTEVVLDETPAHLYGELESGAAAIMHDQGHDEPVNFINNGSGGELSNSDQWILFVGLPLLTGSVHVLKVSKQMKYEGFEVLSLYLVLHLTRTECS